MMSVKNLRPLLCVCILSAMLMAALALSPGLSELMRSYGVSESTASLSITLPYLVSIPFTLLTGRLTEHYSKKSLSLIGVFILCLTGLLPYFLSDFSSILVVRAFMGVGLGLLFTLAPSLAPDYYPEGKLRSLTIGMQSAWAGSGGFVFNILSGYLVCTQAKNIFLVYGLCVAAFFLVLFLLPNCPATRTQQTTEKQTFDIKSLGIALLTFLFLSAGMTLSLSVSVYFLETGFGGSVEAGYATSAYSAAAFLVGCCYIFVSRILKRYAVLTAFLISSLGMLLCVSSSQLALIYVGAALIGAGLSIFMPSCVNQIIRTVPPRAVSMGIAVMMVGSSIGQTFSGYMINPAASLFGSAVSARFYVSAGLFLVVALLSLLFGIGREEKNPGDVTCP